MKPLYVAMKINKWTDLHETETKRPLTLDGGSIGCLLVYESVEQLQREHPAARWVKIDPDHGDFTYG